MSCSWTTPARCWRRSRPRPTTSNGSARGEAGRLVVGTFQSVSHKLLPTIIGRMKAEQPGLEVRLFETDDDAELVERLITGELDLSFVVEQDDDDPRLETIELVHDRYIVLTRTEDAATGASVPARTLHGAPLVGVPAENLCQRLVDRRLDALGVEPIYVFRSIDNGAIQAMVRSGLGRAVMPYLTIDPDDPGVVVQELDPAVPPRRIAIARRAGRTLAPSRVALHRARHRGDERAHRRPRPGPATRACPGRPRVPETPAASASAAAALVEDDRLLDRDEVAAVLAVGLGDRLLGVGAERRHLVAEPAVLGLELEHPLHAGQVEALGGELLDAAQERDVGVAVAAAAAPGAGRVDQALALVDAQRLRVDAGQLGGDRDDVDGVGAAFGGFGAAMSAHPQVGARGLVGGGGQRLDRLALGRRELGRAPRPRR